MTPSTYLKMPANWWRLCHYAVIKWNISSKYLDIERKKLSISFYPASIDLLLAILFHFSPRNLDLDRLRQPYQTKGGHNLYYMHGDFRGGHPWRGYDELMARNYVWYGMAVVVVCISIMLRICQYPQRTCFTWNQLAGYQAPMRLLTWCDQILLHNTGQLTHH